MYKELAQQVLTFVDCGSQIGKLAADLHRQNRQTREKVAQALPDVVDRMVKAETVPATKVAEAREVLSTHEGALTMLGRAVEKIASRREELKTLRVKSAASLGQADGGPASITKLSEADFIVGGRTVNKRPSDIAWLEANGVSV